MQCWGLRTKTSKCYLVDMPLINKIFLHLAKDVNRILFSSRARALLGHQLSFNSIVRTLHVSTRQHGLEEFFDNPKTFGKRKITKIGSPWTKDQLRRKSLLDLHKLWFVLLKERNMLLTLENICRETDEPMPGEERLEKVAESMSNLRDIITERETAKNMLLKGTPDGVPGEWRKSSLGDSYYYTYKEHLIPQELQKKQDDDKPVDIAHFDELLEEWHLRREERRIKLEKSYYYRIELKWNLIRKRNPSFPKSPPTWFRKQFRTTWKYGMHPDLPIMLPYRDSRFINNKPLKGYR
uniref:Large ribosomal subunit protein uL29m n=1 Tax=Phallusia mammillata TaxID=59560 RepID=A0A6F9DLZ0_9ASCI|nr:39S ribosomal protein L47, mitochondrial-like [Phallusia mammillata]